MAPEVRRENIPALVEHYKRGKFSGFIAKIAYYGCRTILHPRIRGDSSAIDAAGKILQDPSKRLMVLSTHESNFDPFHLAALATRKPLRPLIGNTMILSKPSLFRQQPIRFLIEKAAAVPIFRQKDSKDGTNHNEENSALMEVYAGRMGIGQHIAGFPAKERDKELSGKPQPFAKGFGRIACQVDEQTEHAVTSYVLPVGTTYANNRSWLGRFRPDMHVGLPYKAPTDSPEAFTDMAQKMVNIAQSLALHR